MKLAMPWIQLPDQAAKPTNTAQGRVGKQEGHSLEEERGWRETH